VGSNGLFGTTNDECLKDKVAVRCLHQIKSRATNGNAEEPHKQPKSFYIPEQIKLTTYDKRERLATLGKTRRADVLKRESVIIKSYFQTLVQTSQLQTAFTAFPRERRRPGCKLPRQTVLVIRRNFICEQLIQP
jgi:hypothetical protein